MCSMIGPTAMAAGIVTACEAVGDTVGGWWEADRSAWSAADHNAAVRALVELHDRVEAALLDAVAAWDRREAWSVDGSLTAAAWLRSQTSMADVEARRIVRSARLVARHPDVAKAVAVGDITAGHVDALALRATAPRADLFDEHVDALLDAARSLSVDDTHAVARRWAAYADDRLNRGDPAERHARRGLWMSPVGELVQGRFVGDPAELAVLRAALDRLQPPDPADTPGGARSLAQRRYDALVALAHVGTRDDLGRVDADHTVDIVIDAATLAGGFDPDGRSELLGGGSVLPLRVQQLLCDSRLSRVILGSGGEVLELGRAARFFSPAQKRAIRIRDGGCAVAGCDRPPAWTDVHHLDPYGPPTHGETNLDNGVSLCRPHHTLVHDGWTPVRRADGRWDLQPP